ncbi:GNAT family N-acetyltransferase [Sphaerisporangium aureirubrum]|uniref:GNAT family N-acetyltransferase n=1 Tax=Sphaerisporangium aureirubrum TaxID=1544736 RepID=A0ABW1NG35_9ACTN
MQIMSFPEEAVPLEFRTQILDLWREVWPSGADPAHDPALHPVSMILVDDGHVLATLDILTKQITHAGRSYRAGGLSTVVTRSTARRRGHGHHLVSAAHTAMAAADLDIGLFTCDRPLAPFYESAGWHTLPGTVLVGGTPEAPFPSDHPGMDKVTMADFFSPRGRTHRLSFEHARVELYPGEIDKLW